MPVQIDQTRWPIIVLHMSGRLEAPDVKAMLDIGDRLLGDRKPYALIYEAYAMSAPALSELKPLFAWMDTNAEGLNRYFWAMGVVTRSAALRGTLRAILALRHVAGEQYVTAEIDDAIDWATGVLSRAAPKRMSR